MADPKEALRSYWVEDLEFGDAKTELPYSLAAWDYVRPHKVSGGPSAEDLDPLSWSIEVERRREELKDSRLKKQAEEEKIEMEKRQKQSKSPPESTMPFSLLGIRLEVLRKFVPEALGTIDGLSCEEVYKQMRNFLCSSKVKSFTGYLEGIERLDLVSRATCFISYSSSTKYSVLMEALEDYFADNKHPQYVWIDMLCRNYHDDSEKKRPPNFDAAWFRVTLPDALREIGNLLVVYDDPRSSSNAKEVSAQYGNPLLRTWCLYELQCALQMAIPVDITVTAPEKETFVNYLYDPSPFLRLVARVDITDSYCGSSREDARIVGYIEEVYYPKEVNSLLRDSLRRWVVRQLAVSLSDVISNPDKEATVKTIHGVISTARRFRDRGHVGCAVLLVESTMQHLCPYLPSSKEGGRQESIEEEEKEHDYQHMDRVAAAEKALLELWDESYSKEAQPASQVLDYLSTILRIKQKHLPATSFSIASTLRQLGRVTAREGKHFSLSLGYCKQAMKLFLELEKKASTSSGGDDSMRMRSAVADMHHLLGEVHRAEGDKINVAAMSAAQEHGTANTKEYQAEFYRQLQRDDADDDDDNDGGGDGGRRAGGYIRGSLVGHYRTALRQLKKEVDIRQRLVRAAPARACSVEDEQLSLSCAWSDLGAVHAKLQNGHEAGSCYRHAQQLRQAAVEIFERDDMFDVSSLAMRGSLQQEQKQEQGPGAAHYNSSIAEVEAEAEVEEKARADEFAFSLACYEEGACMFAQQDYMAALMLFNKALHAAQKKGKRDDNSDDDDGDNGRAAVATAHMNIALVYDCMRDSDAALRHLQEALDTRLRVLGDEHIDVAATYNCLGLVQEGQADAVMTVEEDEDEDEDEEEGGGERREERRRLMKKARECYAAARAIREGLTSSLASSPPSLSRGRGRGLGGGSSHGGDMYSGRSRSASPQSARSVQTRWRLQRLK